MCGIAGVVERNRSAISNASLEAACRRLRHRGPDQQGCWVDSNGIVGLAAVRLAVLDPSHGADQPMHRGTKHLAFNGEIYNFKSIRQQLIDNGDTFTTNGDTEVVLAACARWGTDALTRLNGMWSLVYYDDDAKSGFLARDRFGIKPLFYGKTDTRLIFASELRALSDLGAATDQINQDAMASHLVFGFIPDPMTIWENAYRLPPGHFLKFGETNIGSPQRYYDPTTSRCPNPPANYGDACRDLRRLLSNAVAMRRVADVPVGAFLSGGLDSSIITGHLAETQGKPVKTFSVGFADQGGYDESRYARLVADYFDTDHHEVVVTRQETLQAIPELFDHLGEPVGDSSIVPTALLSKATRQQVTVALSGDGSDELFGGYWRYMGHAVSRAYRRFPEFVRHNLCDPLISRSAASKSSLLGNRLRQARKLLRGYEGDALGAHLGWSRILPPDCVGLFHDSDTVARSISQTRANAELLTRQVAAADPLDQILAFDLQCQLPADMLQKVDLASMMHSLEVRVPFLDPSVVELAASMPASYKVRGGLRKRVLVDAYRGRLPDEVLDRPKQGFELPIGEYLRGPLRELFMDTVTPSAIESLGTISYPAVQAIYGQHCSRRTECADLLFALMSLCWWRRSG